MAKYKDKWKTTFPAAIGNQTRPEDGVDNTQEYNTDGMPQYIANDPVRYDLQNAVNSQLVSNDERLNEKINKTRGDLAAHNKDPKAHATGISGNAATATKLQTARTLSLSGKASGSATFDGSADAAINVTFVNADTASKLSTARKINITGNASGSTAFDGSGDVSINVNVNESKHAAAADTLKSSAATETSTVARPVWLSWEGDNTKQTVSPNLTYTCSTKTLTSTNFKGHLAGNADSATNDGNGANIANAYLKKSGGSMSGALNFANATWNLVGDDSYMGDHDIGGTFCVKGANGETGIALFKQGSNSDYARISYGGGNINFNKKIAANLAGTADNADTVGGIHAASMFYSKGNWASDNWATIGTYQVNGNPPVSDAYGWGQVISSSTTSARFQLYASHQNANGRLRYRTGWDNDKGQPWNTILDSENYNLFAPTKTGGGASGTWPISISGNAAGLSGDLVFPEIGNTNTSQKITWNGSTDGADIYYQTTESDQGNLVLNLRDDANCYLRIAANGAFKSYFSPDGAFHGNVDNADKVDGYHASDLLSKAQGILPKTAAEVGQFRELVVNDSHQIKLPDGGTWAYFVYTYNSWSGDDANGEHRTRTGAGIAAGGTVLHTDGNITSNTINAFKLSGTAGAGGADGNNIIVGGFCWRIA